MKFTCSAAIEHWSSGCHNRNNIEALSEQLESLQITNEALGSTNNYTDEMSNALAQVNKNVQAGVPKIKMFKQGKKNIANFMIEFEALAMKADIDDLHAIFLLKKNVQADIIKLQPEPSLRS